MSKLQEAKLHLTNELKPAKLNNILLDKIATVPPVYALIYLHLNALARKDSIVQIEKVRSKFSVTYADILATLTTFEKMGLLYFKQHNGTYIISFSDNFKESVTEIAVEERDESKRYTPMEIEEITSSSPELKEFYKKAQSVFNYTFSYSDYESLFYIHDEFLLSLEAILAIINHCKLENKLNMNYLEKKCRALSSEGVREVEDTGKFLNISGDLYAEVLKALGIKGTLKPVQKDVIDRWITEYNYSKDMILEACDKACLSTNNPNLNYVNGILKNWFMANIKTLADIEEYEKSYSKGGNKNKIVKNSLNNFDSTKTDYDEIEHLERAFLDELGD